MKKLFASLALAIAALGVFTTSALAAPANDNFANAITITSAGYGPITNAFATVESGEPAHEGQPADQTVWFKYTAPSTQNMAFYTCSEGDLNTALDVYVDGPAAGTSVADLTRVTPTSRFRCGNAPNGDNHRNSYIQLNVTQNAVYYIAIGSLDGGNGFYELHLINDIPDTVLDSGPAAVSSDSTPTFTYHGVPAAAGYLCGIATQEQASTQGVSVDNCPLAGSYTSPALPPGKYTFVVVAGNADGGYDDSAAKQKFEIVKPPTPPDTTAPETTITAHPKKVDKKKRPTFAFSSNEATATFECSLNGAPFTACASPKSVKAAKGRNVFQVRATDAAGNVDNTPASYTWKFKKKKKRSGGGGGKHAALLGPATVFP